MTLLRVFSVLMLIAVTRTKGGPLQRAGITLNFQHGMRDFVLNGKTFNSENIPAFYATLTSGHVGPSYTKDAIRFNDVSINVGNGYNPSTGKFTAPANGIYQISLSYLQQTGYNSHVQLIKDGTKYTELHSNHKGHDQLSTTVLMQLKKGQSVWVRLVNHSTYAVYGNGRYTTFTGHLISY